MSGTGDDALETVVEEQRRALGLPPDPALSWLAVQFLRADWPRTRRFDRGARGRLVRGLLRGLLAGPAPDRLGDLAAGRGPAAR